MTTKRKWHRSTIYRQRVRQLKEDMKWQQYYQALEALQQQNKKENQSDPDTTSTSDVTTAVAISASLNQTQLLDQRPVIASTLHDTVGKSEEDSEWTDVPPQLNPPTPTESASSSFVHDQFKESACLFSIAQGHRDTLCPCTELSVNDVVLMVVAVGMRHNLTWVAQLDMLKILSAIFPKRQFPVTKHRLLKKVKRETVDVKYHVFCPACEAYLTPRDDLMKTAVCPYCELTLNVKKAANYFASLSIRQQLQELFQGPEQIGHDVLEFIANRRKKINSNLEDIFDGTHYRQQCQPGGILSDPYNFSYNFFTDGVPMGHSGKSIWPIYLMINELPEKIRNKYVVLGGLYIGPKEPNLNVFMKPFVHEANLLSSEGFTWSYNGVNVTSKAIPMCAIADSPARCRLLNMQGHAAKWGCTFCYLQKQKTLTSPALRYLVQIGVSDRTLESTHEDLQVSEQRQHSKGKSDRHWRGVYGPSSVASLKYFNICENVPVDYMHCVLVGAVRAHTEILLIADNKELFWNLDVAANQMSINDIIALIDKRLLGIQPPKSITRTPQSLTKRKIWKASEWRSWILFYCIVCLKGLLKDKYLVHLAKLSMAIYILLQDSISEQKLAEAHNLLVSYQCEYQEYFGQDSMTYNIHLLRHVCMGVLRFGPIWTHSAFPYEGQNRHTLQMLTSPFSVVKQIVTRYLVNKSFPNVCVTLCSNDTVVEFCEDIMERHLKRYVYNSGCYLLGSGHKVNFTEEDCTSLSLSGNRADEVYLTECSSYQRMLIKGFRVDALGCHESSKTKNVNNYVIVEGVGFSAVERIILTPDKKVVILVRQITFCDKPIFENVKFEHVKRVEAFRDLICIYPGQLIGQCVLIDVEGQKYVSKLPYGCYRD